MDCKFSTLKRYFNILFVVLTTTSSFAKQIDSKKNNDQCQEIYFSWMEEFLDLTQNCVGYSPPVAARTFFYIGISNYEAISESYDEMHTLSKQLEGFDRKVWLQNEKIHYPHLVNCLNKELAYLFFPGMAPSNRKKVDKKFADNLLVYNKTISKREMKQTKEYAVRLVQEIFTYSQSDGGHEGFRRNFPASYVAPIHEGCWERTYPGYTSALLPFWGGNRLSVPTNDSVMASIPILMYDEDSSSFFYKQNTLINDLYKNKSPEYELIAEYWDDSPGVSGTPAGHQFSIALNLAKSKHLSLNKTCELFALLGIALNDAMIESWKIKYNCNLIRPITFIQRNINPEFHTILSTPPFPEFPSGHSVQAGAAGEVFKYIFGNGINFTDITNAKRTDIDGTPRSYSSIDQMTAEMSISRFYGGIHYPYTLNVSYEYGSKLGANCVSKFKL